MMTPGDFASLQEGREGLSTEDYVAWKLPYVCRVVARKIVLICIAFSEEEDPDDYPFPLTLKAGKSKGPTSPVEAGMLNGAS